MTPLPASELGVHLADADTADALSIHTGGCGLIIGVNDYGRPVAITLFRPEPTAVLAVGGLRLAQLIAFRALGIGAQLFVETGRPAAWSSFARESGLEWGASHIRTQVGHAQRGTLDQPQLLVVDSESSAVAEAEERTSGPWSAVLTVRSQLSAWDTAELARADLVLMQRLSDAEAKVACPLMNLPDCERALTMLRSDAVALITHSELRIVRVDQTSIEQRVIGEIDRLAEMAQPEYR